MVFYGSSRAPWIASWHKESDQEQALYGSRLPLPVMWMGMAIRGDCRRISWNYRRGSMGLLWLACRAEPDSRERPTMRYSRFLAW